ncbi:MAG: hypothetical protein A2W22_01590 [Candidatus Levybacteria bacterium RBG_16_35_11]|nr:MAG: hypothetical protein A2W22_01590 [Candidatus Levybacteria bacterium RBG_16_35_11]
MHKKEIKNKECKDKTVQANELKGFHEEKNVLSGKSQQHQASAMKNKFEKEQISEEIAITPADKEQEEKALILRFKDSNRFLDAVYEFEELKNITIPLDFDEGKEGEEGSFLVGVSKEIGIEFQNFMKEKGFEMPEAKIDAKMAKEIDAKITEVQNSRSKSALDKDNSITAQKVGKQENPEDVKSWLAHPNLSDLETIDTATEKKKIS